MKIEKLLIAVTFHYDAERLKDLSQISSQFKSLADNVTTVIVTNTSDKDCQKSIHNAIENDIELFVPEPLSDPFRLTWCHFDIFKDRFKNDPSITHFMYLEDDIQIQPNNIEYWLKGREELKIHKLIPSFCRYEVKDDRKYSVDNENSKKLQKLKYVSISDEYSYVNLDSVYQGMYLLDRELTEEHLFGPGVDVKKRYHGIREQAAQGLSHTNIPANFNTRYAVGFNTNTKKIDPNALIHHVNNRYVNIPSTGFGKLPIDNLIL
jgi:hypothetical protein